MSHAPLHLLVQTCGPSSTKRPVTAYSYAITDQRLIDTFAASAGRVTKVTNPESEVTQYGYDSAGNLAKVTVEMSTGNLVTRHYHDTVGNLCKTVDPRGTANLMGSETNPCTADLTPAASVANKTAEDFATSYAYDKNRRLTRITNPLGHYTKTTYNANGWVQYVEDYGTGGTRLAKTSTEYFTNGEVKKTLNAECFNYPGGGKSPSNDGCETVSYAYNYPADGGTRGNGHRRGGAHHQD